VNVSVDPRTPLSVYVLREDPDLAAQIPPERRPAAIEECVAPELRVPAGTWAAEEHEDAIGLLVLEGLLVRRIGIQGRHSAELLGQGDLIRPWQREPEASTPLEIETAWTVFVPLRVALLGGEFTQYLARYPELAACLVSRAIQRSRNLAMNVAIVHQARVDTRLHLLMWHLAHRWGRVRSDGTLLPLRLTHALLADLVAARRPTVTSALSELARDGSVRAEGDGWLLTGSPPGMED
jgi:CRP/FNR family transcriptional regulator, cyclic AMP receptor protein